MKILLTGSNGQLGKACQAEFKNEEVLAMDVDSLDITRADQCEASIKKHAPDVIIHAAAYTDVKAAQANPALCYQVNMAGTYNLALNCQEQAVKFVYISTDFVFDGRKSSPYTEDDPVGPLNVYGRSKLAGELVVQDLVKEHFILRPAWMYGEGKNFVKTIIALAEKQSELKVVSDQCGTPTYAKDLASFIRVVLTQGEPGIYHASNEGETTWADFAQAIIELAGKRANIIPISSEEARDLFGDPTLRPAYSVMSKQKLGQLISVRPWREALREYLK